MRSTPITTSLIVLVAIASGAIAPTAHADDETEQAQAYFDQGAQYYFEGEYGKALVEFHRARELRPHPMFSYNIAMSHRQLGHLEDARDAAERALEMDEPLPEENEAQTRSIIVGVETVEETAGVAESVAVDDEAIAREEMVDDGTDVLDGAAPDDPRLGRWGWSGLGTMVAGAAVFGGSVYYNGRINDEWEQLETDADELTREQFQGRRADIDGLQTRAQVMFFSGIGLATIGAGLVVADLMIGNRDDQNHDEWSIGPAVDRPGVRMMLHW